MIFGEDNITSGASNDIEQATQLAHTMVTKYGMSDKVCMPPRVVWCGVSMGSASGRRHALRCSTLQVGLVLHRDDEAHSPETQAAIDQEVRRLCQTAYSNARAILTKNRAQLERLAAALLEYETLTNEEIQKVMKGEKLRKEIGGPAPERCATNPVRL
jgi:ATP-dependent Zn protease